MLVSGAIFKCVSLLHLIHALFTLIEKYFTLRWEFGLFVLARVSESICRSSKLIAFSLCLLAIIESLASADWRLSEQLVFDFHLEHFGRNEQSQSLARQDSLKVSDRFQCK